VVGATGDYRSGAGSTLAKERGALDKDAAEVDSDKKQLT